MRSPYLCYETEMCRCQKEVAKSSDERSDVVQCECGVVQVEVVVVTEIQLRLKLLELGGGVRAGHRQCSPQYLPYTSASNQRRACLFSRFNSSYHHARPHQNVPYPRATVPQIPIAALGCPSSSMPTLLARHLGASGRWGEVVCGNRASLVRCWAGGRGLPRG